MDNLHKELQQEALEDQGIRTFSRNRNAPKRKKRRTTLAERICYFLASLCVLGLLGIVVVHFIPDPPANIQ
ncbi:hypothetical protein SAMN05444172_3877 [Burkholderia sp. GAS332]|jgi:hypothetical protein|uniref:hypothetical protein n=1 Tax=Paraburkholderia TaxID=1822464 RepID=UPI0009287763|nr:hypothetical protein SAMN05444172_3877 [Burkholderia sp. GAS332]